VVVARTERLRRRRNGDGGRRNAGGRTSGVDDPETYPVYGWYESLRRCVRDSTPVAAVFGSPVEMTVRVVLSVVILHPRPARFKSQPARQMVQTIQAGFEVTGRAPV
jgi:hypothetical protein